MPVGNYWTLTKTTTPKRSFWSNLYQIKVMIISLWKVLELPRYGHMTPSTVKYDSRKKILLVTSSAEIMAPKSLFQNTFILRKPRVAIFADITKIVTIFITKNQKSVKRNRNYVPKCNLYCISWYSKISWFAIKKCWYQ